MADRFGLKIGLECEKEFPCKMKKEASAEPSRIPICRSPFVCNHHFLKP